MSSAPKSEVLRAALATGDVVRIAGAYDAISARLAERHGFDALWASGLSIGAALGFPDAGLLTLPELVGATTTMDRYRGCRSSPTATTGTATPIL